MVRDVKNIRVYSYQRNTVILTCPHRTITMTAAEGGIPTVEYLTFEEIEYINSRSPVFKTGMIEFEEAYKDELCEELHIDASKCLYEKDIDDMLIHPCAETLKKIVSIDDLMTIERVRGHMAVAYGSITQDVRRVVETRYNEINNGTRKSAIQIGNVEVKVDKPDIDALMREIERMKGMLAAQAGKEEPSVHPDTANDEEKPEAVEQAEEPAHDEAQPVKRRGRPAKAK